MIIKLTCPLKQGGSQHAFWVCVSTSAYAAFTCWFPPHELWPLDLWYVKPTGPPYIHVLLGVLFSFLVSLYPIWFTFPEGLSFINKVFLSLFQERSKSPLHCELLVFGLGSNPTREQRPRHTQRHLQQQRHCPFGARGWRCHQTFQKGQNQN